MARVLFTLRLSLLHPRNNFILYARVFSVTGSRGPLYLPRLYNIEIKKILIFNMLIIS